MVSPGIRPASIDLKGPDLAEVLLFHHAQGDIDAARALVQAAPDAELFLYPGNRHPFTDSSLPSYDESAATQLTQRVLSFLEPIK
jgi:dienelactone hydrolase